jgi:hypothetical protein
MGWDGVMWTGLVTSSGLSNSAHLHRVSYHTKTSSLSHGLHCPCSITTSKSGHPFPLGF